MAVKQHQDILEAIIDRDPKAAEQAMAITSQKYWCKHAAFNLNNTDSLELEYLEFEDLKMVVPLIFKSSNYKFQILKYHDCITTIHHNN
jgi:hypothetical protein